MNLEKNRFKKSDKIVDTVTLNGEFNEYLSPYKGTYYGVIHRN